MNHRKKKGKNPQNIKRERETCHLTDLNHYCLQQQLIKLNDMQRLSAASHLYSTTMMEVATKMSRKGKSSYRFLEPFSFG